ncbi:MAG TPA: helix-turn-helix transcriptional regulator [Pseudonocardiaceae bacterium]|jgi:transcriptional regulator with XRE-family HTH domain|nr:helix-turn-helix transcriptional regulator [Pseudonocardiaceae bacterium]
MSEVSPSSRGRELGEKLRALRDGAGLTSAIAAERVGISASKLSRLENGLRGAKLADVENLLSLYGVDGGADRAQLLDLVQDFTTNGWRGLLKPSRLTKDERLLVGFEDDATEFRCFADLAVPPLLQTGTYARALFIESVTVPLNRVEQEVAHVLARQAILSREQPPVLSVVLTELVLRTVVKSTAAMAAQLLHLVNSTSRGSVELRVLPMTAGAHAGINGRFAIMGFAGVQPVVHMSHGTCNSFTQDIERIAMYERMYARLVDKSLGPQASLDLIAKLANDLNRAR